MIQNYIRNSMDVKRKVLDSAPESIEKGGRMIADSLKEGGKVMFCGNGGSSSDAQHIAAELLIRYKGGNERPALPALSLAADSSALTAGANDYGYDNVFSRQVEGLGKNGDVVVGITTSGNSENILRAFQAARKVGVKTILLTGETGGKILQNNRDLVDLAICVPSTVTGHIQESHIMIGHLFCSIVEKDLYNMD